MLGAVLSVTDWKVLEAEYHAGFRIFDDVIVDLETGVAREALHIMGF